MPLAKNYSKGVELFSARQSILGPGDLLYRLYRCFSDAKQFMETTPVERLIRSLFADEANIRVLLPALAAGYHIGFMVENVRQIADELSIAAHQAGFSFNHSLSPSTIIARELGALRDRTVVPTTIFRASTGSAADASSVEAFIPKEKSEFVRKWIADEVVSHVGLTLANPSAFETVRRAFEAETFCIPAFMGGKPLSNSHQAVTVVYFDRVENGRKSRVELLWQQT